jgi:ABC-type antimicrobial peptide transport system permease subunit
MGARVRDVTTLDSLVGNTLVREKLLASIAGAFGVISLILATVGIYGVLSYSVSRRTREIGIRAALGAQRHEILALVIRDAGALAGGGLLAGLAGSIALNAALRSLLFEVRAVDPTVIATATGVFVLAASIATGVPARRAAAMDPTVALRFD